MGMKLGLSYYMQNSMENVLKLRVNGLSRHCTLAD
jgi:hypothetical protein